jgi:Na+/melibiose symporter-like transporter
VSLRGCNVAINFWEDTMKKTLPKRKMIRYCLSDIAKGLFNGMIGNYLLYFFHSVENGDKML